MKRTRSVSIDFDNSGWALHVVRHEDGTGEVALFWGNKTEPTHTQTLTVEEADTLHATLRPFQ